MPGFYTTREIAELFHQPLWHIQRLFEDGNVPEPGRFAGKRIILSEQIPAIAEALKARGWIRPQETAHAS